jgi:serine/threonine protein kinase
MDSYVYSNEVTLLSEFEEDSGEFEEESWIIKKPLTNGAAKVYEGTWGTKPVIFKEHSLSEETIMKKLNDSECFPKYYGTIDSEKYDELILMEKKEGDTLSDKMKQEREQEENVVAFFKSLVECAEELNKKKVIHGDIRDENVLWDSSKQVHRAYIIDFDVSRSADSEIQMEEMDNKKNVVSLESIYRGHYLK